MRPAACHPSPPLPITPPPPSLPPKTPKTKVDLDFDDDEDARVLLLVHDTKPPFLKGKAVLSSKNQVTLPLRDPTSDMAVIAKWVHVLGLRRIA